MGGTLHLLTYETGQVEFWEANQALASITSKATQKTTVGSYLAQLDTDGLTMYAQLPEGVYNFDDTPNKIIDTQRALDQNCVQVIFQNNLYFKNNYSLMKYDGSDVTSVGFDREDGLPFDKWGKITAMTSSWKYIFAAVQGPTYSHILTMDADHAWQYYARIPSPGLWVREMFLNNSPDGLDRLWCAYGNYSQGRFGYFLNPMVNPLQAGTYSYVLDGNFSPPVFDGGLLEVDGVFLDVFAHCDAMGSYTPNRISLRYGLDGDPADTVTLEQVRVLNYTWTLGSPYGAKATQIQPSFRLETVNTGSTPVFRKAVIHYLKDPDKREVFDFTIDLNQTAIAEAKPVEAILGTLSAIADTKVLMPFWYGQIGTKRVKVLDIPSQEDVEDDSIMPGERSGLVTLKVAEII